jgi:hypothetical protein
MLKILENIIENIVCMSYFSIIPPWIERRRESAMNGFVCIFSKNRNIHVYSLYMTAKSTWQSIESGCTRGKIFWNPLKIAYSMMHMYVIVNNFMKDLMTDGFKLLNIYVIRFQYSKPFGIIMMLLIYVLQSQVQSACSLSTNSLSLH